MLLLLALLVACAPSGDELEESCNHDYDPQSRTVDAAYVPYRWCNSIAEEAALLEASWTCTSTDGQLDEDVEILVTAEAPELDEPQVLAIEPPGDCIEVVTYPHTVSFESSVFSASARTRARLMAEGDGDRSYLFDDQIRLTEIEGSLVEDVDGHEGFFAVEAWTRDPMGTERTSWRLQLGTWSDESWELECR